MLFKCKNPWKCYTPDILGIITFMDIQMSYKLNYFQSSPVIRSKSYLSIVCTHSSGFITLKFGKNHFLVTKWGLLHLLLEIFEFSWFLAVENMFQDALGFIQNVHDKFWLYLSTLHEDIANFILFVPSLQNVTLRTC